jgi:putative chitinase
MTPQQLATVMPFGAKRAEVYAPLLTAAMAEFQIDTPKRQAAFLAHVGHESGSLKYTLELADGTAYEGREDLGNTMPGDGPRYRGRGLMQVTGRSNYAACGEALGLDLIFQPELLEQPSYAARSAGWFWSSKNLNRYADADRFAALTKAINGGYTHLDERIALWLSARKVLGL